VADGRDRAGDRPAEVAGDADPTGSADAARRAPRAAPFAGIASLRGVTGVGIDAVEVERLRRLLEHLPRAYERLFSAQERGYADSFADPYPRYAARFAAKEAVGKALGIGIIGFVWREIEVLSGGKPRVALHGRVAEIARRLGVTRVELSLSHTAGMAYAVAVAVHDAAGATAAGGDMVDART
jgi:holo-[acyl-carrier protein] synthase